MIVSATKNFIYCRIPKTASTSVSAALEPFRRPEDRGLIGKLGRRIFPASTHPALVDFRAHSHWGLQAAREVLPADFFENAFKFTVSRHPFARTISAYNHILRMEADPHFARVYAYVYGPKLDLDGFVATLQDRPLPPQAALIVDYSGAVLADATARVELLDDEIGPILDRCGIDVTIPKLNQGSYETGPTLSQNSRAIIRAAYAVDFELFGYDEEGVSGPAPLRSGKTAVLGAQLQKVGAIDFTPWEPAEHPL